MPLFRRTDGDPVTEPPVRRIMPYLMRRRNESAVYQETVFRIGGARAWLRAYNRTHADRATLFHLVAYACARALHARPVLNRFVSGGRLWQRRGVSLAFAAKVAMADEAPVATVKLEIPRDEPFEAFVARMVRAVERARAGGRSVDREVALVMRLPGPLIRLLVALVRWLDGWNLLPGWFTRDDPMFSSLFLANLGSAGVSDAYHHLYEYGTCSVFGAISAPRRMALVEGDAVAVREGLRVSWTLDERVGDAFYAARSLALVQATLEDPERHLGPPAAPAPRPAPALAP